MLEVILLVLVVLGAIALFGFVGNIFGLIVTLATWALIGWAASQVMGNKSSILDNILIGILGGIVGSVLFGLIGIGSGGFLMSLISGTFGAIVVLALWRAYNNNQKKSA